MTAALDLDLPAGSEVVAAHVGGRPSHRLMVILRAPGCCYAQKTGGCSNCGFQQLTTSGAPVPEEKLLAQLRIALVRHAHELGAVEEIDLYCSGSFLCDAEIPEAAQGELLTLAASAPRVRTVLIESRPEYITAAALARARAALARAGRTVALEVAVGLESADEEIRERRVRKGFTLADFERAARLVAAAGAGLVVYLLLKPVDTEEDEALVDVAESGDYLRALGERLRLPLRVALEPVFVVEGTALHAELRAGRYRPPSLWSVVRATLGLRERLPVQVGLSDEGLTAELVPRGCFSCTPTLRRALARFNETQDRRELEELSCAACGGPHPGTGKSDA